MSLLQPVLTQCVSAAKKVCLRIGQQTKEWAARWPWQGHTVFYYLLYHLFKTISETRLLLIELIYFLVVKQLHINQILLLI